MASKNISKLMLVLLVVALFSVSVSAFGIVMPYWDGRPLVLSPGESKDVVIKLQNVEEQDITVEVKLVSGGEVATIIGGSNVYNVPKGTTNTLINLNVVIPDGAAVGSSHEVSLSIKDVSSDKSGGMVRLTTSIAKSFKVEVVAKSPELPKVESPKEPERNLLLPMIILCLVIILVVLMLVVHFKNKNKKAAAKTRKGKGKF